MQMARRAIELDPRYAQAYARLAELIMLWRMFGWMEDEAAETAEAVRFAHLAVQLAPNDSIVLTVAAVALGILDCALANPIPCSTGRLQLIPMLRMPLAAAHSCGFSRATTPLLPNTPIGPYV